MNSTSRQIFQTGAQVIIAFLQALVVALYTIGGFPTNEQLYLAILGSAGSAPEAHDAAASP